MNVLAGIVCLTVVGGLARAGNAQVATEGAGAPGDTAPSPAVDSSSNSTAPAAGSSSIAPTPGGAYTDSAGGHHLWSVTPAHTLVWDGAPWIPTGLVFNARSLSENPSAEAAARDSAWIQAAKAQGISDLLVAPPRPVEPETEDAFRVSDTPTPALQSLLDTLEQGGFHYGIDLRETLPGKMDGYCYGESFTVGALASPGQFAAPAPPGTIRAVYVARDGKTVIKMGRARLENGVLLADAAEGATSLYFIIQRSKGAADGVANLWDGFSEARDHLLIAIHSLKLGPGLRFLLNPMDGPLAPVGRAAFFYPASRRFRLSYEVWLHNRYGTIQALGRRWALDTDSITDFASAARLVPDAAVRPTAAWDPDKDATFEVTSTNTAIWSDFELFRTSTVQHDMDILASSLRHNVADLPVIYRWQRFSRIYGSAPEGVTFDGLAVNPQAEMERGILDAAYTCAQISDATPQRWFFMYGGEGWTLGKLANLVDLGAKGFFLQPASTAVQRAPNQPVPPAVQPLPNQPVPAAGQAPSGQPDVVAPEALRPDEDTLNLLKSLRSSIAGAPPVQPAVEDINSSRPAALIKPHVPPQPSTPSAAGSGPVLPASYAAYRPQILWFPWDLEITSVRRFKDGSWWLPTLRRGESVNVGPDLEAYRLLDDPPGKVVVWAVKDLKPVRMVLPADSRIDWPAGTELGRPGKTPTIPRTVPLGDEPLVFHVANPLNLFPVESFEGAMEQAAELEASILIEQQTRERLAIDAASAKRMADSGMALDAYTLLSTDLDTQRRIALPFIWIEGEKAFESTFSGVATSAQCSGGAYLWLNTPDDPPQGKPYAASWSFEAATPGSYNFWLGGTPPGQDWSSAVTWSLDDAPLLLQSRGPAGASYRPLFHWCPMGEIQLTAGKHTLRVTVTRRRFQPDNSYSLGIDAIALNPTPALIKEYLAGKGTTAATVQEAQGKNRKKRH